MRRTRVVTAYMRLVAQPATRRRELRVRLRRSLELALGRHRDRRARDDAKYARVEWERELERIGRERGDLVAARTRIARGEGGVRNYAEARPRAANGARAVAVRSGRRTTRVTENFACKPRVTIREFHIVLRKNSGEFQYYRNYRKTD